MGMVRTQVTQAGNLTPLVTSRFREISFSPRSIAAQLFQQSKRVFGWIELHYPLHLSISTGPALLTAHQRLLSMATQVYFLKQGEFSIQDLKVRTIPGRGHFS